MDIKTDEDKARQIQIITQSKGQLEASVTKVEPHLIREEFEEYCDALSTCTAYMLKIQKRIKDIHLSTDDISDDFEKPF